MKRGIIIGIGILTAWSATAADDTIQTPAYRECISLTASDPAQALVKADAWIITDDGVAAHHCRAMALYGLKRYPEAAASLTKVRTIIPSTNSALRSFVSRQAAAAWVKAGQRETALGILDSQINELSANHGDSAQMAHLTSELLVDRARIFITAGNVPLASKDLNRAVSLNPVNADALLERAKTFELQGDYSSAKADADAAATMNPSSDAARRMQSRLEDKTTPMPDISVH